MREEGWYTDPYRRHEARWFSDGTPTELVRDQGKTSKDPAPGGSYAEQPKPVPEASDADDLQRADDEEQSRVQEKIWTIFTRSGPT